MKNACYIAPFKMNGLNDVDDQKNITMPLRRSQFFSCFICLCIFWFWIEKRRILAAVSESSFV